MATWSHSSSERNWLLKPVPERCDHASCFRLALSPCPSLYFSSHPRTIHQFPAFLLTCYLTKRQSESLWRWLKISASNQNGFQGPSEPGSLTAGRGAGCGALGPRPPRIVLPSAPQVGLPVPGTACKAFTVYFDGFCAFDFASLIIKGKKLAKSSQCVSLFYHDLWVRATVFTKCLKMCQKILVTQLITGHIVNSPFKDTHGFERDQ